MNVGRNCASTVDDVISGFQDVFSTELGLIDGPPVHLQLKEGATPKFCRESALVTDHQPLLGLLWADRPTPSLAAGRIQRWSLFLGGFHYKLQKSPDSVSEPDECSPPVPGAAVFARNFGVGEKWLPGTVTSTGGSRMVTVQTPAGPLGRHVDQVAVQ
ncbi:uncharacterized protein LOC144095048 isoform X2 [Amblyomma americanum]